MLPWLPFCALVAWLCFTVAVFAWGPYEYEIPNRFQLYTFLIAVHLALVLGFWRGSISLGRRVRLHCSGPRIAKGSITLSAVVMAAGLMATRGGDIGRVKSAMSDPEAAYLASSLREGFSDFSYVGIISAPFWILALSLGIFHWRSIGTIGRALLIFLIASTALASIGAAIRSALVALIVQAGLVFLLALRSGTIRVGIFGRWLIAFVAIITVVCFFEYSSFLATLRSPRQEQFINPITFQRPNESHLLYRLTPEEQHRSLNQISFYISHPYYRLSETMQLPWVGSGWGFANSVFLIRNVARLTGWSQLEDRSLGLRLDLIEVGRFGLWWSTAYSWIASDLTFPGTVIFVFFIGYLLALAGMDAVSQRNPFAVAAYAVLGHFVFSLPMNSPLQDGPGISAYAGLVLLWWFTRSRIQPVLASEAS